MAERWNGQAYVLEDFGLQYDLPGVEQVTPRDKSPLSRNVLSYPGRVVTRPGLTSVQTFTPYPVSIKEFVLQDVNTRYVLMLGSDGTLSRETGTYTFASVNSNIIDQSNSANMRMNSVTAFGREWIAFSQPSNGPIGIFPPCNYDGGSTPAAVHRTAPAGPTDWLSGASVTEGGAGSGTAGLHKYRVCFQTKFGYITPPSLPISATLAGSKVQIVQGVPTGPPDVVARIICATAAGDEDFYYVAGSAMVIGDNTTTTATIDFSDSQLIAGSVISVAGDPDSDLRSLIELAGQANNFFYHGRICWVGERTVYSQVGDIGFQNTSFDGGFDGNRPLGWLEKAAGEARGPQGSPVFPLGDCLKITGDGATQKGCLENNAVYLSAVTPGTEIRARVRGRKLAGTTGTFDIRLVSSTADAITASVSINSINIATQFSATEWTVVDTQVVSAAANVPTSSWRLRISGGAAGNVISNAGEVYIDYIELYPGAASYQPSLARWSRAGQPDAYDAVQGYQYVAQDNGERLTSGFVLGQTAYFVKQSSFFSTRDDGAREPAFWPVNQISSQIGSPSPKGVGIGDQWVVIAGRAGLYYFSGGLPKLLSEEFRTSWKRINWQYGYLIDCKVDMDRKVILVAAPLDSDTESKYVFCVQWFGADPTDGPVRFNLWTPPSGLTSRVMCMATSERSDGTRHFLMGVRVSTGGQTQQLVRLDETAFSDWGNAIDCKYRTPYFGDVLNRKLLGAMRFYARGAGSLAISSYMADGATSVALPAYTLSNPPKQDAEYPSIRHVGERAAVDFSVNTVGSWFSLEKFAWFYREKPFTPDRGMRN